MLYFEIQMTMKSIFKILIPLFLVACIQSHDSRNRNEKMSKPHCENSVPFGDIYLCLPEINNMTECYDVPIVKERADRTESEENLVLAYYLNNEVYNQVENLDDLVFDDYFKIYGVKKMRNLKATPHNLNRMAEMMEASYFTENWKAIQGRVNEVLEDVTIDTPVLIDNYSPHKNIRTGVLLMTLSNGIDEFVLIGTANLILIKDRIVALAYYKSYTGPESVNEAKSKNDYIALRFMQENTH